MKINKYMHIKIFLKKYVFTLLGCRLFFSIFRQFNYNSNKLQARSVFIKRTIKEGRGYFYCHPMPTISELDFYYTKMYWLEKSSFQGVKLRDLDHWMLIHQYINLRERITFLNFGAGHAGI